MNFEPELRYHFYCISNSVLLKFIAAVFEFSLPLICYEFLASCTFKIFDTNFPPIISPANFETQFPSYNKPSEYKPLPKISPPKRSFEKYKPWGLFSEFYGSKINGLSLFNAPIPEEVYPLVCYVDYP